MKKLLKISAIMLALLTVAIFAALTYVMRESFQTDTANDIIAKKIPNSKIGRVSVGFTKTEIENADLLLPNGDKFFAKKLYVVYSPLALLSNKVDIAELKVEGAKLLIAKKSNAEKIEATAAESKKVKLLENKTSIEKSDSEKEPSSSSAPESPFFMDWQLSLNSADIDASATGAEGNASIKIRIDNLRIGKNLNPENGKVQAEISAASKDGKTETLAFNAEIKPDAEKTLVDIVSKWRNQNIASLVAKISKDFKNGELKMNIDVDSRLMEAASAGIFKFPEFKGRLSTSAKFSDSFKFAELKTSLKAEADKLKNISENLSPIGKCLLTADVSISKKNGDIKVSTLSAQVLESDSKILEINTEKAFTLNINDFSKLPDGKLLYAKLNIPVRLISAFAKGVEIESDTLTAELTAARESDGSIVVNILASLSDIKLSKGETKILSNADISAAINTFIDKNSEIKSRAKIGLASSGEHLANIDVSLDFHADKKWNLKYAAKTQLPKLESQPACAILSKFSSADFEMSGTLTQSASTAAARISNLISADGSKLAKEISLGLKASFTKDFTDIKADLNAGVIAASGTSDISVRIENAKDAKISITSKNIICDDFIIIASAFSEKANAKEKSTNQIHQGAKTKSGKLVNTDKDTIESHKNEVPENELSSDAKAFWSIGRNLEVNSDFAKILWNKKTLAENLSFRAKVDDILFSISKLSAKICEAPLSGGVSIEYAKAQAQPYSIKTAILNIKDFEVSKIFADEKNPPLSGLYNLDFNIGGTGKTARDLAMNASGKIDIKGGKGVLRILSKDTSAGKAARVASVATKIASAFFKERVEELDGVSEVIDILSELKYDSANVSILRNANTLDMEFKTVEIKSPTMLIAASGGKIAKGDAVSLADYTLNIPVSMYVAKGEMQKLFAKAGLATNTESKEFSGYYNGASFTVSGTIAKPDNDLVSKIVAPSAAKTGSSILQRFLK